MNRFLSRLTTLVVGMSAVAALTVRDCLAAAPVVSVAVPAGAAVARPPIDPDDPPNVRPRIVSITAAPPSGPAPLSVQFSADAYDPDGEIVDYAWTFGDGQSAFEPSPAHVYAAAGTFTARLTVTDDGGLSASRTVTVQVTGPGGNLPPQVSANASPTSGVAPLNVQFSASASDPDGQVVAYFWDFGDGQTASDANPAHTYSSPGTYTARVTVTDNGGLSANAAVTVQVMAPVGADFIIDPDPMFLYRFEYYGTPLFGNDIGYVTAYAQNFQTIFVYDYLAYLDFPLYAEPTLPLGLPFDQWVVLDYGAGFYLGNYTAFADIVFIAATLDGSDITIKDGLTIMQNIDIGF